MERFRNDDREFQSRYEEFKEYLLFLNLHMQIAMGVVFLSCFGVAIFVVAKMEWLDFLLVSWVLNVVLVSERYGFGRFIIPKSLEENVWGIGRQFFEKHGDQFLDIEKHILRSNFYYFLYSYFCPVGTLEVGRKRNGFAKSLYYHKDFIYQCIRTCYFVLVFHPLVLGIIIFLLSNLVYGKVTDGAGIALFGGLVATMIGFFWHSFWYWKVKEEYDWSGTKEMQRAKVFRNLRQDEVSFNSEKEWEDTYDGLVEKLRNIDFDAYEAWKEWRREISNGWEDTMTRVFREEEVPFWKNFKDNEPNNIKKPEFKSKDSE